MVVTCRGERRVLVRSQLGAFLRITPGVPDSIYEHSNELVRINDELRLGVNKAVSDETFEQYRQGYRCLNCDAAQEEAFPEECAETKYGICGYQIKEKQLTDLENQFRGTKWYGPTPLDVLDEEREREAWAPRKGIWLPTGL